MENEDEEQGNYLDDDEYEPGEQEIGEYCEWLGMNLDVDKVLAWIAREALKAPLPENWKICYTEEHEVYYFNIHTGESIWDHPMDAYYKALYRQEKVKLEKKRRKMRFFVGSLPLSPLQEYYSELTDDDMGNKFAITLPDHLTDPIDLRLFIDPVVLPTSGRTVSKHTIVNNNWRDPFSREYIENRRLIPNVDKRNEVIQWLGSTTTKHFEALTADGTFQPLLKLLPYILDKECEVSLQAQNLLLAFLRQSFLLPARGHKDVPSPTAMPPLLGGFGVARRNGRRPAKLTPWGAGGRSAAATPGGTLSSDSDGGGPSSTATVPRPPPEAPPADSHASSSRGFYELLQLTDEEANLLAGCLLTMSTMASLEMLYLILDAVPPFRSLPAFRGFSPEVLNALHLSPTDLKHIEAAATADETSWRTPPGAGDMDEGESLCATPEDPEYHLWLSTSNEEHILQLKWVLLLLDAPTHLNVLEKVDWRLALHLVVLTVNSPAPDTTGPTRSPVLCRLLRGLEGWPGCLKDSPPEVIRWLVGLALLPGTAGHHALLLYDLLVHGGEAALGAVLAKRGAVVDALFAAAAADSAQGLTHAAMLGALLVFHDCCRLADFAPNTTLTMAVMSGLLPRLTRQQWRPRHFEETIAAMVDAIARDPREAWQMVGGQATAFLVRELAKKKRQSDGLQAALEALEGAEAQLRQSHCATRWAVLSLKLLRQQHRLAPDAPEADYRQGSGCPTLRVIEEHEQQRARLEGERARSLVAALRTLLAVRLKSRHGPERHLTSPDSGAGKSPLPPRAPAWVGGTVLPGVGSGGRGRRGDRADRPPKDGRGGGGGGDADRSPGDSPRPKSCTLPPLV